MNGTSAKFMKNHAVSCNTSTCFVFFFFFFFFSPFCRYCAYLRSARALYTEKLCTCICALNDSRGCIVEEHLHHHAVRGSVLKTRVVGKKSWRWRETLLAQTELGKGVLEIHFCVQRVLVAYSRCARADSDAA